MFSTDVVSGYYFAKMMSVSDENVYREVPRVSRQRQDDLEKMFVYLLFDEYILDVIVEVTHVHKNECNNSQHDHL